VGKIDLNQLQVLLSEEKKEAVKALLFCKIVKEPVLENRLQ
jgi:hypothetical protein